jgi:hypothetical protein
MTTSRTLHVDRAAQPRGNAASLHDVLARLLTDEIDVIVLHRYGTEWDEYGVISYLAATWPLYLSEIQVRSISADGDCAIWNAAAGTFHREPAPTRPHREGKRRAITDGPKRPTDERIASELIVRFAGGIDQVPDDVDNRAHIERFRDDRMYDAGIETARQLIGGGGEDQDHAKLLRALLPQERDHLQPADARHHQIEEDDVEVPGRQRLDRFFSVEAGNDLDPPIAADQSS